MKKITTHALISVLGGLFSIAIYKYFIDTPKALDIKKVTVPIVQTSLKSSSEKSDLFPDFISASEKSVSAVVHVKNLTIAGPRNVFEYLFSGSGYKHLYRPMLGTGSGIIISPDGYIVTNNHVVKDNSKLEVTLNNNKTYEAKVIGVDSDTDIALIKIDPNEKLPTLAFGNSDDIRIGEWALAVGNPFNLTSTVTAGIISAKARDLNPSDSKNQSFIQTDAVVNPGNSGGALVNTHGEVIGMNTAISSNTGSYVGYSFAIPSNIIKKVVQDLIEYGSVQKVILGLGGVELNSINAEKLDIKQTEGFYVNGVEFGLGADKAGIKLGDIIQKIDQVNINHFADMSGYLSTKRPGDVVDVQVIRKSKIKHISVKLSKNTSIAIPSLGISVKNISEKELKKYKVDYGVKISRSHDNQDNNHSLLNKVIIQVNQTPIKDVEDLKSMVEKAATFGRMIITLADKTGKKETLYIQ